MKETWKGLINGTSFRDFSIEECIPKKISTRTCKSNCTVMMCSSMETGGACRHNFRSGSGHTAL